MAIRFLASGLSWRFLAGLAAAASFGLRPPSIMRTCSICSSILFRWSSSPSSAAFRKDAPCNDLTGLGILSPESTITLVGSELSSTPVRLEVKQAQLASEIGWSSLGMGILEDL